MNNTINKYTLDFQNAFAIGNHNKALEIRDKYLHLTQKESQIKHNYLREFYYLLEESNDLDLLLKYYQYKDFSDSQRHFLSNKIAKLVVPLDYEKAFEYSTENEIKYLVTKELSKKDIEKLIFDLDLAREQRKMTFQDYDESLLKIAFESFEKYPEISESILDKFKNRLEAPSDILDLQILLAVKKSKDNFENIDKYLNEVDNLDFVKAKVILEIVDFYKDDIDKVIDLIFIEIDKFHSDFIKYDTVYNIQKVTNKDYSKKLQELSKSLQLDDDNISFDNEVWFGFLVEKLNG
ncbi:hypothetical protein N5T95_08230 [Aliarcobacter cryaerophilus]|uniref:hypothetical protein n=1 Tax=Aliarcobacter cryaerophilus TaxID=28198 RepID=UPI0021B5AB5E|nr:hypothetical protein [Aliarcobacter cryaerophilus]MCT7535502.1 hypothetical protein [Aliarcobacter cryaerophilus]